MAATKKPAAVDIVFGMGKPSPKPGLDESGDEARDTLKAALEDAGLNADSTDTVLDALHSYIESCTRPSAENSDEGDY